MAGIDDPLILDSARKRYPDGDLLHAYWNPTWVWDLDDCQMFIGPARDGTLLEIGWLRLPTTPMCW